MSARHLGLFHISNMKLNFPKPYRVTLLADPGDQSKIHFDCFAGDADEAADLARERGADAEVVHVATFDHGNHAAAKPLRDYVLQYGEYLQKFECKAESLVHAIEQCANAYPGETIASATLSEAANPAMLHWNAEPYVRLPGSGHQQLQQFGINIQDQRASNGQVYLDFDKRGTATPDGEVDRLTLMLEVNDCDAAETPVQCVHVHFEDGDCLAFSIFKSGKRLVLRPETGVELKATLLHNGDPAFFVQ